MTRRPRPRHAMTVLVATLLLCLGLAPAALAAPGDTPGAAAVVALVEGADVADLQAVLDDVGAVHVRALVGSHGLHVVGAGAAFHDEHLHGRDPGPEGDAHVTGHLVDDLSKHDDVVAWVEDVAVGTLEDERFHAWPSGDWVAVDDGDDTAVTDGLVAAGSAAGDGPLGDGVLVAVLDTGADPGSAALAGRVVGGWDFVDDDADPSDVRDGIDDDGDGAVDEAWGHGGVVAQVIARRAPGASLLVYRVLDADGSGEAHAVAAALDTAVLAGADVVNASFGFVGEMKSKVVREAFKRARKAGVLVVAAAGNHGGDQETFPAGDKHVLGVAALDDATVALARFSNRGKSVRLAAPGTGVTGTLPDGRVVRWDGTSFAAPHASAELAVLLSRWPDDDPEDVLGDALKHARRTADDGHQRIIDRAALVER